MADVNSTTGSGSVASPATQPSLIERLKASQSDAWRQLADLYGPLVYYWCRRYGLQPQDAADVFQEVFAAVFQNICQFRHDPGRGRFRGWLWTITRNKIQDHFRARDHRQRAEGGTEALRRMADLPEHLPEPPSDPNERREDNALLQRALQAIKAEFEPRTWDAFWRVVVAQEGDRRRGQGVGHVGQRGPAGQIAGSAPCAKLAGRPDGIVEIVTRFSVVLRSRIASLAPFRTKSLSAAPCCQEIDNASLLPATRSVARLHFG